MGNDAHNGSIRFPNSYITDPDVQLECIVQAHRDLYSQENLLRSEVELECEEVVLVFRIEVKNVILVKL